MLDWWIPSSSNSLTSDALATMCMTGDNLREDPYNRIYPRITTKSNTFTVHYRVQVLKNPAVSDTQAAQWTEGRGAVLAEYRGSSLIERYIDPNDPNLNAKWDTANIALNLSSPAMVPGTPPTSSSVSPDLSTLYKFRVISTKKFAP
jgi:hypothetical protein